MRTDDHVPEPGPSDSLVLEDLPLRLHRRAGLVPSKGLGVGRRALAYALLAWLPIAAAALWLHLSHPASDALGAFAKMLGLHARCLIAIPLFIVAEGTAHAVSVRLLHAFSLHGLVPEHEKPRVRQMLEGIARLRMSAWPWLAIGALAIVSVVSNHGMGDAPVFNDAASKDSGAAVFGRFWYLGVSRALFLALLFAWLWRVAIWCYALLRLSRFELSLVPTHPDHACGLGFMDRTPAAFAPVVFGISAAIAASWTHAVVYRSVDPASFMLPAVGLVVVLVALMVAPLLAFSGLLSRTKQKALIDYGGLLARHGRLVHQRWIERLPVDDDPVLNAPELGPVADTASLYELVKGIRLAPVSLLTLVIVLVPLAVPFIPLLLLEVPIAELAGTLLKSLL